MKRNKKHERRVKKLIVACGLCAIILSVSTFAWFIGFKTVNVKSFDIEIAAIDSLELSLNGVNWADSITISSDSYSNPEYEPIDGIEANRVYEGNTNSWGGAGLVPMSSVGIIDAASSRLILYEKGSLTPTEGGYRLMASRVTNGVGETEERGYVAFDLFIKNLSGNEYYEELNIRNEEAIYLTPESSVTVSDAGGVANTGIENSVRVAFAQIGRVVATTEEADTIQGINCTGGAGVTSICSRVAQIWEPNDTDHVQNAINYYNESCKKRTGTDVEDDASYAGACGTITNGTAYPTYAISGVIDHTHNIDVYDGAVYNGYTTSIATSAQDGKLYEYDTFTDTEKDLEGKDRPEFMRLAPNSITKVRVYVYLEGQDVDNYDFASLGKKITVAFGFGKQQFYGDDVNYDGNPELPDGTQSRPTNGQ